MPAANIGRLSPSTPVYQVSGESTPSQKLPTKFKATPQPTSPLSSHLNVGTDFTPGPLAQCVVRRWPRMKGFRRLYARGARRMPIQRLGADGSPLPWTSSFQPNDMGPIRNAGFNDALFQAGYPGFNLGLSFKVPGIKTKNGPRVGMISPITISQNRRVVVYRRPSGKPDES